MTASLLPGDIVQYRYHVDVFITVWRNALVLGSERMTVSWTFSGPRPFRDLAERQTVYTLLTNDGVKKVSETYVRQLDQDLAFSSRS